MTNIIKNEFNNFRASSDYLFSVDGDKQIYTIYSRELKQFLREIIVNKILSERFRRGIKMEGHTIDGDYFSYEGGVGDLPDRFIANAGWEEKFGKRIEEVKKQEEEAKRRDREIRERIEKEGLSPENHSFHFSRWEGDNLVEKKSLFLNYNPFELENVENNSSKIQQITDKERKLGVNQQNSNKDSSSRNVYYGIGLVFLILVVISMIVVWVKRGKKLK